MILGIVVVSDINAVKRMFGQASINVESEKLVDLSLHYKSDGYVSNSSHAGLWLEHISYYMQNNSVMMVETKNSGIISNSAAIYVNVKKDILPNYDVHIFYYPWYGNPKYDDIYLHWNHRLLPHWKAEISTRYPIGKRHQPPDDIGSSYYPRLGPYSSRDPVVIADHMRQIWQSGAGYVTVTSVEFFYNDMVCVLFKVHAFNAPILLIMQQKGHPHRPCSL